MIVFENGAWQSNSLYPDSNYLEGSDEKQPCWIVPDGTELAERIKYTPHWEPVADEAGKLIDIIPVKITESDTEERAELLKSKLDEIDRQAEEIRAQIAELSEEKAVESNG